MSTALFKTGRLPKLFDLTEPINSRSPRSHDQPPVEYDATRWYSRNGSVVHTVKMSLHIGTHIDTAALYYPDGETVDRVPLDRLVGPALVIDCRGLGNWVVVDSDFLNKNAGDLRKEESIVFCSGWHRYYYDEQKYELYHPGLDKSGVDWLAERGPKAVGADAPSSEHIFMRYRRWKDLRPDVFVSEPDRARFPTSYAHKTLLPRGIVMVEKIGGEIESVVGRRVLLFVMPIICEGMEAAPARVMALPLD